MFVRLFDAGCARGIHGGKKLRKLRLRLGYIHLHGLPICYMALDLDHAG